MMWAAMIATATAGEIDLMALDLGWVCVNDTVMGGVSQSQVVAIPDGQRFTGTLSLDNNGGFTSVRTESFPLSLSDMTGFRVTVQGDGRTYAFTVRRQDIPARGFSYRAMIETDPDEPVTVELPLSAFQATAFGRSVSAPPLYQAPELISSVGFLLADQQPGPFALDILSVEAIVDGDAERVARPADRQAVLSSFSRAIERGVPAFNQGNALLCAAVYQTAIESALLLAPTVLTESERDFLLRTLSRASEEDAVSAAWTLRRGMDALLQP